MDTINICVDCVSCAASKERLLEALFVADNNIKALQAEREALLKNVWVGPWQLNAKNDCWYRHNQNNNCVALVLKDTKEPLWQIVREIRQNLFFWTEPQPASSCDEAKKFADSALLAMGLWLA